MSDLNELVKQIIEFNQARGWTPKESDLAKSVLIEGSELLEHYQWDDSDKGEDGTVSKNYDEIGEEVADVFWYLVTFCNSADIDLAEAVEDKMKKNQKKYPEEKFKGKHNDKFYKKQKREYRDKRKKK